MSVSTMLTIPTIVKPLRKENITILAPAMDAKLARHRHRMTLVSVLELAWDFVLFVFIVLFLIYSFVYAYIVDSGLSFRPNP